MRDVIQFVGEEGVLATIGVVDDLIRYGNFARCHGGSDASYCGDGQHAGNPGSLERPEIGPVIHPMRRDAGRVAMAGEKNDLLPV